MLSTAISTLTSPRTSFASIWRSTSSAPVLVVRPLSTRALYYTLQCCSKIRLTPVSITRPVYPGHCTLTRVATTKAAARRQQRVFDSRRLPLPISKPTAAVRPDCCRGRPSLPVTLSRLPFRARGAFSALPWQATSGREIAEEAPSDGLTLEKDGVAVRRPASDDVGLIWAANR